MQLFSWLTKRMTGRPQNRRAPACRPAPRFRPQLEALEERWALSTLTVLNNLDSGAGSLRAEIAAAKSNDTIVFAPTLAGKTIITLTSGELDITKNLTIQGPGADNLIVSGGNASRVFEVDGAKTKVTLSGLVIVEGDGMAGAVYDGNGGGVLNFGTLTISGCDLSENSASLRGGGVFNYGTLTVSGSNLGFNYAQAGAGICNFGTLTVSSSTISGNEASQLGGAIANSGTATISGCTLSNNHAGGSPGDEAFGGAIYNSGKLSVSSSTLSGNNATYYGGAIWDGGTSTVSGCTLSGNSAGVDGGAIYNLNHYSKMTISDSIFSSNSPDNIFGKYTDKGGNTFR